jgi:putative ABC transport system permease protein
MDFLINFYQITTAIEQGFIFSLVAMGMFISFRVLQFPDLTVDGTFPLGAGVCAVLILNQWHPLLASLIAALCGFMFGLITAWLSTKLKMLHLLAGILTMTALYSINLRVMGGRPNVSLLGEPSLFPDTPLIILGLISFLTLGLLTWFLSTRLGLSLRATGANAKMARAQGINDKAMIALGLGLSNALVAFSGALFAQANGFADITMGVGTIIVGLAAVIIGEAVFPKRLMIQALMGCVLGTLIYRIVIAQALNLGTPSDTNAITAILVALAMASPALKKHLSFKKGRR